MARLRKRLTDHQEYEDLVMVIIQSTDPDTELQDCINAYLQPNPKFYLMMFQAISKIREAAILSNDEHQVSGIDNLEGKLLELESKLYEKNNIIQADLPDSILYDKILKEHLSDHMGINYDPQDWRSFQNYIEVLVRSNPKNLELPILTWCEEMLRLNLKNHMESCQNPINCPKNQSYDKRIQYITRLIEDATPIQPEQTLQIQTEVIRIAGKKIQWLGNQKELAELFVELKKKGWIEKFEYDTIQDCFTESHSIPHYLKPATDRKTKEATYDNLYSGYSPLFYGIKENPKRHK